MNREHFLRISVSPADVAPANSNCILKILVNGFIPFLINAKPTFLNGRRGLPKNLPNRIILEICAFGNCNVADKLFAKAYEF